MAPHMHTDQCMHPLMRGDRSKGYGSCSGARAGSTMLKRKTLYCATSVKTYRKKVVLLILPLFPEDLVPEESPVKAYGSIQIARK